MQDKDLIIINNEKISKEKNFFYCDNIDIKSIPESLKSNFNIKLIARSSDIKRDRKINIEKIEAAPNIFKFLSTIIRTFQNKDAIYLIISITPYTFLSYLLLFLFKKKRFIYLRSSGHEEYKAILGFFGPLIYHLMFKIVTFKSNIIKCQDRLFAKKSYLVRPSEIDSEWLNNVNEPLLDKPRLLYVGRIKAEKGIFSLLKIFEKIQADIQLSIAGKLENKKLNSTKLNYIGHCSVSSELIKIYDNHNIFVLPSFTEAHPKVIDESLARARPVIIFEEIKHVAQDKQGIFISKRNPESFLETVNFIMKNYKNIQKKISKNKLPTKKDFISQMSDILSSN
tara:strand:+ start:1056 stop:2072 length:1017 start_codon:yes stop_codon:yes gene_type:complete